MAERLQNGLAKLLHAGQRSDIAMPIQSVFCLIMESIGFWMGSLHSSLVDKSMRILWQGMDEHLKPLATRSSVCSSGFELSPGETTGGVEAAR